MLINDFASYFKLQRSEIVGVKSEFLKNYNTDIQGINAIVPQVLQVQIGFGQLLLYKPRSG